MKTLKEFRKDYKKEVKRFILERNLQNKLESQLDEVLVYLRNLRNKYDKNHDNLRLEIEVEEGYYGDGPSVSITLIGNRMETNDEYNERVSKSYDQYQRWEDKDKETYERLKRKYGDKS